MVIAVLEFQALFHMTEATPLANLPNNKHYSSFKPALPQVSTSNISKQIQAFPLKLIIKHTRKLS